MVLSAIWKKTCTSEFFKDYQNCTSPKDECNLNDVFEKPMSVCFFKLHEKPYYYLFIIYMKKLTPAIFFTKKKRQPFLSHLKTPKCFFFVLFLLEFAVSYWLCLLLFHILSQSESLNSHCTVFHFWHCISKKLHCS